MMDLTIIIVSYNTEKYLKDCLESIYRDVKDFKYKVIVVDNNSSDGSAEMVERDFPETVLIKNEQNLGFGEANNLGADLAKSRLLVFLNPDTLMIDNSFVSAIEFLDKNKDIGVLVPKIYLEDRKTVQPHSFGPEPNFLNLMLTRFVPDREVRTKDVGWVTGACLFIRTELFRKIGGFDKRFFMYFEDIDLCMMARQRGYKVFLYPKTKIVHLLGKSITKDLKRKKIYWQSQRYFYKKHYGVVGGLFAWIINLPRGIYLRIKHE